MKKNDKKKQEKELQKLNVLETSLKNLKKNLQRCLTKREVMKEKLKTKKMKKIKSVLEK
jgi:hypothetical protein